MLWGLAFSTHETVTDMRLAVQVMAGNKLKLSRKSVLLEEGVASPTAFSAASSASSSELGRIYKCVAALSPDHAPSWRLHSYRPIVLLKHRSDSLSPGARQHTLR